MSLCSVEISPYKTIGDRVILRYPQPSEAVLVAAWLQYCNSCLLEDLDIYGEVTPMNAEHGAQAALVKAFKSL